MKLSTDTRQNFLFNASGQKNTQDSGFAYKCRNCSLVPKKYTINHGFRPLGYDYTMVNYGVAGFARGTCTAPHTINKSKRISSNII